VTSSTTSSAKIAEKTNRRPLSRLTAPSRLPTLILTPMPTLSYILPAGVFLAMALLWYLGGKLPRLFAVLPVAACYAATAVLLFCWGNHLIPVDAPMGMKEFEAVHRNVSANLVLGALAESGSNLNIVILDCCRDNPFARSWRSASSGLAEMKAPQETLMGNATAPGSAALDGEGKNSPYSIALAEKIVRPGLQLEEVFKNVARRVFETTKGAQRPWISLDVLGDFTFRSGAIAVNSSIPSTVTTIPLQKQWKVLEQVEPALGGWRIEWDMSASRAGSQVVFEGKKILVNGKTPSRGELAARVEITIPMGSLKSVGTAIETNHRGEKIISDIECVFSPTWLSFEMVSRVGGEMVSKMVGSVASPKKDR
jgi:hypothetical protein